MCIEFVKLKTTEFWLAAGCWQGKFVLWTEPTEINNFTVDISVRIGHRADILSIKENSNFIITASADGHVSIWNIFSGTLKCSILMPIPTDNFEEDPRNKR
jgi:WD40 repeat protein